MRVLFIDEDLDVQRLVEALNGRYVNDSFELATNLAEALDLISTKQYDVIVVDMWLPPDEEALPGSSRWAGATVGILVLKRIEDDDSSVNYGVPTLIFSGLAINHHEEIRRLWERREKDVFRKPMRPDRLYDELKKRAAA